MEFKREMFKLILKRGLLVLTPILLFGLIYSVISTSACEGGPWEPGLPQFDDGCDK